jgi:ribosomal protein L11 methyltransferase
VAWLELTLRLPAEALPRAEALLQLAGALSISISDDGDSPILEPEPGTTPLWPKLTARALFDDSTDAQSLTALLEPIANGDLKLERLEDEAVRSAGYQSIEPVEIGPRLAIAPAESLVPGDARTLGLNMGLAFGTGQHPTTRLCLEWLEREMPAGLSVLDYGAGSGVLALAALKLGAASATAIDNEPQALVATESNAKLNGLLASIRIGLPETLGTEKYDLIFANILARPLIALADYFADRQSAGGRIVLSGILETQIDEVQGRYASVYGSFQRHLLGDWALLTGTRRSEYDR